MSVAEHIRVSLELPVFIVRSYLDDLTDAELLERPYEGLGRPPLF